MTVLVLEPHNDDAVLFAAFSAIRHRAHVVTVLRSQLQEDRGRGITAAIREAESECAFEHLGCSWEQWPFLDSAPDWQRIEEQMSAYNLTEKPEQVFAPAVEVNGHDHHNQVGLLADRVFSGRVMHYSSYVDGRGRSGGTAVPFKPEWVALKLRALACYGSQIAEESTGHHFCCELYEYVR